MDIIHKKRGPHLIDFANIYKKETKKSKVSFFNVFKKRRIEKKRNRVLRIASYSILALFALVAIIVGINIPPIFKTVDLALEGKNNLQISIDLAKRQDFAEAVKLSETATLNFQSAGVELAKIDRWLAYFPFAKQELNETEKVLLTAEIMSRTMTQGETFALNIQKLLTEDKNLSYSKFSPEEKRRVIRYLSQSGPELSGMKANLDLALYNLNSLQSGIILRPFKDKIAELNEKAVSIDLLLTKAIPLTQMLPVLLGYPENSYFLVLFQNQDELRPTGGFIGNYGLAEISAGDIVKFDTHDVYHLDMPVKDAVNVEPPLPIKKYLVPKWYMRDANWSPDWPQSAKTIETFYYRENSLLPEKNKINFYDGPFNAVVGVTPELINRLFKIIGPIYLEGERYDDTNFTELLQYRVEQKYAEIGETSWNRKGIIGTLCQEIKIRLLDLPSSRWPEIIQALDESFLEKDIIMHFNNPSLREIARSEGWTGEMSREPGDYIMVVDANMGALKTDSVMDRSIKYILTEKSGKLTAKLDIGYSHNGGVDWRTSQYKTYTRVYIPNGAKILNVSNKEYDIMQENGKTAIGTFLTVEPGGMASLSLEYELPPAIYYRLAAEGYALTVQKQPGNNVENLDIVLNFEKPIGNYSPTGYYAGKSGDRSVFWDGNLEADRQFKVFFK